MYRVKTPALVQSLNQKVVWRIPAKKKKIFLTFDDGPHPEITPQVYRLLEKHNAKATFFCVGNNARQYPEIIADGELHGHRFANHTYKHESGFQTSRYTYYKSFLTARQYVESTLFRPPYGRITPAQIKSMAAKTNIILWDVLSGDFDKKLDAQACADNVIKNAVPGSIVVFHDSIKAAPRMLPALEKVLEHFTVKGYRFEAIQPKELNSDQGK